MLPGTFHLALSRWPRDERDELHRRIVEIEQPGGSRGPACAGDLVVQLLDAVDAPRPAELAQRKGATALADPPPQPRVGGEAHNSVTYLVRVSALDHESVLSVAELEADVRPGEDDRLAGSEELRKLGGEGQLPAS